jgi:hypothetical protein
MSRTLAANFGSKPSTPSSMNRACQRQTAVLLTPAAVRMISTMPTPSAVASTIRARQTCFCRLLRLSTIVAYDQLG